jgi:hypothetical protein
LDSFKTKTRKKNKLRSSTVIVLKMFFFWKQKCSSFENEFFFDEQTMIFSWKVTFLTLFGTGPESERKQEHLLWEFRINEQSQNSKRFSLKVSVRTLQNGKRPLNKLFESISNLYQNENYDFLSKNSISYRWVNNHPVIKFLSMLYLDRNLKNIQS